MIKIAILGSCVSRDAIEFANPDEFQLVSYFARSSMASLATRPTVLPNTVTQELNNFRLRMVAADHDKTTFNKLSKLDYDVLILDLIDERFNLLEQSDGSVITLSAEYMAAVKNKPSGRIIKSGSERHVDLWRIGAKRFIKELHESGKLNKLVINKVFWSRKNSEGNSLDSPDTRTIDEANQFLENRYSDLKEYAEGCRFISYPEHLFRADVGHKWGASPFHYEKNLYIETLRQLKIPEFNSSTKEPNREALWKVTLDTSKEDTWTANIHGYPINSNHEFAFYLMKGKERIATRWYSKKPSAAFEIPLTRGFYHVVGFIRCDLGSSPEFRLSDPIMLSSLSCSEAVAVDFPASPSKV